ncbi:NAD(P)H-hydrate epimerase [Candidatus Woesearchaeota archaeon]|nr:NAD(P)H-hydrate epimerase [Candidatus Woesearchaeota archaeon]|tara:strand:+ start:6148 stop:6825 length:678 start_codon:yes stop_codon:yes gene_type:complete
MKALTKKEMALLDKAMIKLGIDVPRMMELAGLFTAVTATTMIKNDKKKKILILSGTGNNGGDGLVAARHLLNWKYKVDVVFATSTNKLKPMPLHQWKILKRIGVKETKNVNFKKYSLIIDGLLGYNINGNPRGKFAKLITSANNSKLPILSIDLPSGLDATTGKAYNPCIKAITTLALTAAKKGLINSSKTGKLLVSYMTVPEVVNKKFKLKNMFSEKSLIFRYR